MLNMPLSGGFSSRLVLSYFLALNVSHIKGRPRLSRYNTYLGWSALLLIRLVKTTETLCEIQYVILRPKWNTSKHMELIITIQWEQLGTSKALDKLLILHKCLLAIIKMIHSSVILRPKWNASKHTEFNITRQWLCSGNNGNWKPIAISKDLGQITDTRHTFTCKHSSRFSLSFRIPQLKNCIFSYY